MLETLDSSRNIQQVELDEEELKILSYIRNERPDLEELFLTNIDRGRKGILHRLLQAIVRENLAGISNRLTWSDPGNTIQIHLSGDRILLVPVRQRHSLARFDLAGDVILLNQGQPEIIEHPVHLLELLKEEGIVQDEDGEKRFLRFCQEVRNSAANYALALVGAELRKRELVAKAKESGAETSLEWVCQQEAEDEMFSPLEFYEQWVVDGHPLHPGAKIKMGLDVADVIKFSPEWGAHPEVALAAVAKSVCKVNSLEGKNPSDILYEEYPGLQAHVANQLRERGLDENGYELIPIHPWQFKHTIPTLYSEAIRKNEIVLIPDFRIRTAALMSFRSLAPVKKKNEGKHHIKTAVNIQTTGAVRTISPNSAENGPKISRILKDIQARESHFEGRFVILEERVTAYYSPSEETLTQEERRVLGANLATILRENPETRVQRGEISMPGSALLAVSPISGKPVAAELIEQFADVNGIADLETAAVSFIKKYSEVALPGFLTIVSRYGISLEGHLQNSVPVFRNGELVRMIVRDFGGIRILPERLVKQGFEAVFYPGSATITDDVQDMRNIICYSVIQNHFGELIAAIVRWLGIKERNLWEPVIEICRTIYRQLKNDPIIEQQAAEDEKVLFQQTIDLKAMATMRLLGDISHNTFAKVPNPLAEIAGGMQ
ncbi:IucA/IucC family protein [Effusibacillus lacus]|uniref:IucA/IucC family siderophore biosynthesis protein n=1 Tax=Effusibacillus lacus TaxID=1348429 RepID=A0A292YNG3_9BACL|nr:IucA/IucC family protein [Effusibacillus lacus]TCS70956.1 siderophore synthetase component [Effusibacillus lacus]GAX90010.1 hypothetical protein EFBL_1636 [Effusibacillus lacus]